MLDSIQFGDATPVLITDNPLIKGSLVNGNIWVAEQGNSRWRWCNWRKWSNPRFWLLSVASPLRPFECHLHAVVARFDDHVSIVQRIDRHSNTDLLQVIEGRKFVWLFSFAVASAGNNMAARIAIMAMTTSSSMSCERPPGALGADKRIGFHKR
jgi:hypothetical protein